MRILIDTCVLIDVLQAREPFLQDSKNVLLACAEGRVQGLTTAKALTDVYYLMHGYFREKEKSLEVVRKLYKILAVADTTAEACLMATFSPMGDYEGAVMDEMACAEGAAAIVTRNTKDYRHAKTRVIEPAALDDFLAGGGD